MYHFRGELWQTAAMKTRTVCLPPGKLLPGMIVARVSNGTQGKTLLAAGTVLDQKTLDNLRRHGIQFLTVDIPDSRNESAISREIKETEARVEMADMVEMVGMEVLLPFSAKIAQPFGV